MVLFMCEDIIQALGNPSNQWQEHALRIFRETSLASLRGKHFVLIEKFNNSNIQKIVKGNTLDKTFLCLKKCNTSESLSVLQLVNVVLVISFHKIKRIRTLSWYNGHKLIELNPSKETNLEVFEETHLLTENLNDGYLFEAIASRYMKKNKIPSHIKLSFLNRNGGGITLSDVYDQEKEMKAHLCITIVDSDKKHPDGSEGTTANTFRNHLEVKWKYSSHHIMKDLSEIENLLPIKFYKNKSNGTIINRLAQIDTSFFDLKCGISAGMLKEDGCYNYWSGQVSTLPSKETILKMSDNNILLAGLGNQTMTKFLKRKAYRADIIGIKDDDLSVNQKNEHKAISNLILNWCISSTPPRL